MPTELVYVDSCVFIDMLQKTPSRLAACQHLHDRAANGEILLVASTICIAEITKLPDLTTSAADQSHQIIDFFENDFIALKQVDRDVAERAHRLSLLHSVLHLDAIHLATAIKYGVSVLYTYDGKKPRRKGLLRWNGQLGNPPLKIEEPPEPPKPPPPAPDLFSKLPESATLDQTQKKPETALAPLDKKTTDS